ncbi:MAG TPA: YncE family protein [Nitrososphaeraceae archaeon]|nr:YncE family protein [Nitrososphaeraceae archaeon]
MKSKSYAIIAAIATLLVVTTAAISLGTPENALAYKKNQAASQTSACGNGEILTNVGCQNTDSQIQGDENAVALTAQQTFPEVKPTPTPPPPKKATLNVIKEVECSETVQTEFPDLCVPSAFTMNVAGNDPDPSSFLGSDTGTLVSLKAGPYEVIETAALPDEIELIVGVSPDCEGDIKAGQELTCTFTNSLDIVPPETATLNVIKEVICPEGFEDVCPSPDEFTINVAGNNPIPNSFPGSAMGTAVSLEPGMYEVTEIAPATPAGLIALPPVFSSDCTGDIQAGQELSCSITNQFISDTIVVGDGPVALEFSPATNNIYVANEDSDTVTVIDSNDMVADTINVGNAPRALEYSETTGNIYVANTDSDTITVIDSTDSVVDTITVGTAPVALEFSPATNNIYVANLGSDTVSVIDSNDMVADTINVGNAPRALEYSETTGNIYVANTDSDTVTVIDSNDMFVGIIHVDDGPTALEYSETTGNIYVANGGSATITIIPP